MHCSLALSGVLITALTIIPLAGCEKKSEAPAKAPAAASADTHDGHDHKPGDGHDHGTATETKAGDGHDHGDGHEHGPTVQLGEQAAGGFTIKASRDGGITPGSDAPIDVWVTGGSAKVVAVRFWLGSEDAKGSVKAKAELEKDNWHTHVEVPKPLPAGSKLWVEVEAEGGKKSVAGFELKN
jgi:ABC-type Zn2+ transport system substrate-binding protein/surface adhesin